jgi:hypothetical protein
VKAALPESVADDDLGMSARIGIVGIRQSAAQYGLNSENLKVISGDEAASKRIFGIVAPVEYDTGETGGSSDSRESLTAIAKFLVLQIGLYIIEENQPLGLLNR